jgi:hypothetical protein
MAVHGQGLLVGQLDEQHRVGIARRKAFPHPVDQHSQHAAALVPRIDRDRPVQREIGQAGGPRGGNHAGHRTFRIGQQRRIGGECRAGEFGPVLFIIVNSDKNSGSLLKPPQYSVGKLPLNEATLGPLLVGQAVAAGRAQQRRNRGHVLIRGLGYAETHFILPVRAFRVTVPRRSDGVERIVNSFV